MDLDLNAYTISSDGSAYDIHGNAIFIPFQRFKDEICKEGHCFVCGAAPNGDFNDEHVFPNWVLKRCKTHNETLALPNGNLVKYGTYKIPCCQTCNSQLADIYEKPVSEAFAGGYANLLKYIERGGHPVLCGWLSLIFTKIHLRDFKNVAVLDRRKAEGMIGDHYDLDKLHHIHAVARAATAGIAIDDQVFGSLTIVQRASSDQNISFDYCDDLTGRGVLLQINDVALIYVLDDCGATSGMLSLQFDTLPNPLSDIQLRELYARYLAANIHIKEQPKFRTDFVNRKGKPVIVAELSELDFHDYEPTVFGRLFAGALGNLANAISIDGKTGDEALNAIATGKISFLFDKK